MFTIFKERKTQDLHLIDNSSPEIDEYFSMKLFFTVAFTGKREECIQYMEKNQKYSFV